MKKNPHKPTKEELDEIRDYELDYEEATKAMVIVTFITILAAILTVAAIITLALGAANGRG
jgi:hypothetical protein